MSTATVLTTCVINLTVLAWLWFGPLARLRKDNFRSDIRRIRDGLFDYIESNGLDYSTPAYVETRQMLNGLIRMSNWINGWNFIVLMAAAKSSPSTERAVPLAADIGLREELERVRKASLTRLLYYVYLEGTTGFFVRLFVAPYIFYRRFEERILAWTEKLAPEARTHGRAVLPRNLRCLYH